MSSPMPSLPWPTSAAPLRIAELRPVLDRLVSLARTHPRDLTPIPGLAEGEGEVAADPPPALEQIVDEFGGIEVQGVPELTLVVEERTDVGPYTLLGDPTSYYPLHEGDDVAVVLTIAEDGIPGAVHGIGEDLALRLAATDLRGYLDRFADALEAALDEVDERIVQRWGEGSLNDDTVRREAIADLLDEHLYRAVLGPSEDSGPVGASEATEPVVPGVPGAVAPGVPADPEPAAPEVPISDPARVRTRDLPTGTLGVADLREAPIGARVAVIDAELPGDPLDWRLAWRDAGLVVCIVGE